MGAFADSLFSVLMSWVRALVNSLWALLSSDRTTILEFLGRHWLAIVVILVAAGLVIDWIIWMIRWKPYALRGRMRKAREKEEEEEIDALAKEMFGEYEAAEQTDAYADHDDALMQEDEADWLPEPPQIDQAEAEQTLLRAQAVPDEELGVYPGMRYDEQARDLLQEEEMGGTRRYAAVHQEGPGAAEVSRRRAEIEAWQQQMQEEARAAQMRRMEEMRRAEEEEERLAQEVRDAEEARLAQEEYQRQLKRYEREKARYEKEMAQYERDLAAYEAAMAAKEMEAAQELTPQQVDEQTHIHRRASAYSDMVQGEDVQQLPASPAWPRMEDAVSSVKKTEDARKKEAKSGLISRMAHLIEPENEEISGVNALPPRVDPKTAYKPAARPEGAHRRRRK